MPNLLLLAAVSAVRVGLYPLSLPPGDEPLKARLAAQLHEGAATLPGVSAFDLLPQTACAPDAAGCLADLARRTGVDQVLTVEVLPGPAFHLRAFENGKLRDQLSETVQGGPLDLAAALEHGVCRVMGAAPCLGELQLSSAGEVAGQRLLVDGLDRGPLPAAPLQLAVGRHLVKVGESELRVRVSYGRTAHARCEERQGAPALLEGAPVSVSALLASAPAPSPEVRSRSRVALTLFSAGAALLVASAGAELYSRTAASQLSARYRAGALSDADAGRYASVRRTGILATALAASGAGAIAASGLVLALSPSGASILGSF